MRSERANHSEAGGAALGLRSPPPFQGLLPPGVEVSSARRDLEAPLFPEEAIAVARAVEARRREFATGRACAREALGSLGFRRVAIPAAADGSPRWPAGVVGSIAHCSACRVAAVGLAAEVAAIGIDAEPDRRLPAGVLAAIALPVEREHVRQLLGEAAGRSWDRLLFSAKEAVYKTWFPLTGQKLRFEDATVEFDPRAGGFTARLRVQGPGGGRPPVLTGRWTAAAGLVATAIALPAGGG